MLSDGMIHVDCMKPTLGLSRAPVDTDAYNYLQCVCMDVQQITERSKYPAICTIAGYRTSYKIVTASPNLVNVLVLRQTGVGRETAAQV